MKGSVGDYLNKLSGQLLLPQSRALPAPFAESFIKFVLMPRLISMFFSDLVLKRNSISNSLNKLLPCKTHYREELLRCRDIVSSAVENQKAGSTPLKPAVEEEAFPHSLALGVKKQTKSICTYVCIYMDVCVYICPCVYTNKCGVCVHMSMCSIYIHMCIYVYECVWLCVCVVYMYLYVYACMCVYVCICVYGLYI